MVHILEFREEFDTKVLGTDTGLVLVDFFADWCGPCRVLAPVFEELSVANTWKASFYKLDIDAVQGIAAEYDIFSIPTVLLFKDGVLVGEPIEGVWPKEYYQEIIDKNIV